MVDALDSKSCVRKGVRVRVPSPAKTGDPVNWVSCFYMNVGTRNELGKTQMHCVLREVGTRRGESHDIRQQEGRRKASPVSVYSSVCVSSFFLSQSLPVYLKSIG